MDTNVKRREWVKTAAIIFLAVLLVLTFFSNTIMNASLPEVATQQVTQGTINAKIRASGTITANETYNEDRPRGEGAGLPEEPDHRLERLGAGGPRRAEAARRL